MNQANSTFSSFEDIWCGNWGYSYSASLATTIGGHKVQLTPSGEVVLVDSKTIAPGKDPVLVSGISAVLHSNGDLVLGTSTVQIISPHSGSLAVTLTIVGHLFTAIANNVAIDGQTLTRNARPIIVSGTPILLGLNGLVVGTSTVPLPALTPELITTAARRPVSVPINDHLAISDMLVVGTPTALVPSSQPTSSIIIGGHLVPLSQASDEIVIAGTTLRVGNPGMKILGIPLALESSALVIGTSTIPIKSLAPSPLPGIGDFIYSAINGGLKASIVPISANVSQAQNNSTEVFLGGGRRAGLHSLALALVITMFLISSF